MKALATGISIICVAIMVAVVTINVITANNYMQRIDIVIVAFVSFMAGGLLFLVLFTNTEPETDEDISDEVYRED